MLSANNITTLILGLIPICIVCALLAVIFGELMLCIRYKTTPNFVKLSRDFFKDFFDLVRYISNERENLDQEE